MSADGSVYAVITAARATLAPATAHAPEGGGISRRPRAVTNIFAIPAGQGRVDHLARTHIPDPVVSRPHGVSISRIELHFYFVGCSVLYGPGHVAGARYWRGSEHGKAKQHKSRNLPLHFDAPVNKTSWCTLAKNSRCPFAPAAAMAG
jgi:hypothetical protein